MLKQWTPGFHPLKISFDKRWLWMIMPYFPLELWTHPILETVANIAGKFIFFDKRSLNWSNKRASWVLVEFDTDLGLSDTLEIRMGEHSFTQVLDYWREPFRCHLCWQAGNLKNNCSSSKVNQPTSPLRHTKLFPSLPQDQDSFLCKMGDLFLIFFHKLSEDELRHLKDNEAWVKEIFAVFWSLLMDKLEPSPPLPSPSPTSTTTPLASQ
jgi:hypothetical protein